MLTLFPHSLHYLHSLKNWEEPGDEVTVHVLINVHKKNNCECWVALLERGN